MKNYIFTLICWMGTVSLAFAQFPANTPATPYATPSIQLKKYNGTNQAPSPSLYLDTLGIIQASGYDGNEMVNGANILFQQASFASNGNRPTSIIFETAETGQSPQERLKIEHDGDIFIPQLAEATTQMLTINSSGQLQAESMPEELWEQNGNYIYTYFDSIGINTSSPDADFHVNGNVFWGYSIQQNTARLMWDNGRGNLRTGRIQQPENWDADTLGWYSFSGGINSMAMGNHSIAYGNGAKTWGENAVALGRFSQAQGDESIAMGLQAIADSICSISIGFNTHAKQEYAVAMGRSSQAKGIASFAVGFYSEAEGEYSSSIGYYTRASGDFSSAMGERTMALGNHSFSTGDSTLAFGSHSQAFGYQTEAMGDYSSALGYRTEADAYGSVAIGRYNIGGGLPGSWDPSNPLFEVGNGFGDAFRSNAFTVLANGYVGVGVANPQSNLEVYGRIQLSDDALVSDIAGQIRWTGQEFQGYDGTSWTNMGSPWERNAGSLNFHSGSDDARINIYPDATVSNDSATIFLAEDNNGTYGMGIQYDGIDNELEIFGQANTFYFADLVNIQRDNGYAGFGLSGASYRIDLPNASTSSGRARANGWLTYSSARWKENVETIDDALAKVEQLRGVYFDWKEENGGEHDMGFIAEEIGQVLPEVVDWEENGQDAAAVNYPAVIPLLVEAIKEQQETISQMQAQIEQLQGSESSHQDNINSSSSFDQPTLEQNRPNPFYQSTQIDYYLPTHIQQAKLICFDAAGTLVWEQAIHQRGNGSLEIEGSSLAAGVYVYALFVDGELMDSKRMVLMD